MSITKLSLSNLELTSLSKNIARFVGLTTLNLSNNGLETLPLEVSKLPALKSLLLRNNAFRETLFEPNSAVDPAFFSALKIDLKGSPLFGLILWRL